MFQISKKLTNSFCLNKGANLNTNKFEDSIIKFAEINSPKFYEFIIKLKD